MSGPEGADDDLVQVAEAREVYAAELMALRLRAAGIEAAVLDQSFRQEPLPSVRAFAVVRVLVPAAQADEARRLLAEDAGLPEDASSEGAAEGGPDPEPGPDGADTDKERES
jgi:hypothetical protein